ncbi:DUF1819 family protein [Patescibacteria group bacterium]|nr:DUF1819 family protein [Patescibacteria group bacterium]
MITKKSTSTIKKVPFNYLKSKMIAQMVIDGLDKTQIYEKCFVENKIQINSLDRRREITNELYRRISTLDLYLLKSFVSLDIITSKFILLYAIAKADNLFYEFLAETYREAILSDKKYISMDDFDKFFIAKKEKDLVVANWSLTTIELLGKGYRKMLVDSALGVRKLKNIYVTKMIIHPEINKYLEQIGDYKYVQAILGER